MPVVVLRHTGGAADITADAVLQRRGTFTLGRQIKEEKAIEYRTVLGRNKWSTFCVSPDSEIDGSSDIVECRLPRSKAIDNIIVLDAQQDTAERVVEKLIQCVSTAEDEETRPTQIESVVKALTSVLEGFQHTIKL